MSHVRCERQEDTVVQRWGGSMPMEHKERGSRINWSGRTSDCQVALTKSWTTQLEAPGQRLPVSGVPCCAEMAGPMLGQWLRAVQDEDGVL